MFTNPNDILPFHIAIAAIAATPGVLLLNSVKTFVLYIDFRRIAWSSSWYHISGRAFDAELY
jgi:hypothetical protein